jgi:hypothetical protein
MTLLELLGDWLHDTALTGLVLLSLLGVVPVAFAAGSALWMVLGVLAGIVATGAVFVPLVRHWNPSRTWVTLVTVAAFDVGVILVLLSR